MQFLADLHTHSRFSVATSKQMDLPHLHLWAQLKGLSLVGTGDCTHPKWFLEIRDQLEPMDGGFFALRKQHAHSVEAEIPPSCRSQVAFVLSAEISTIYKKHDKVRKVHHLILFPDLDAASRFNVALDKIGNIQSDGRPILGLDSRHLLELALEASPRVLFIPAHAWTPHFSVLGAKSGFDSIEECYEDLSSHIHAIETGLSSDPPMNWRVSKLDRFLLVSNSDAHSPSRLARNANRLDTDLCFDGLEEALKTRKGFIETLDMYPQEGKYHYDGHRACKKPMSPGETIENQYLCPVCHGKVTVGVLHRVEELADRNDGYRPPRAAQCRHIIPLAEILSEIIRAGVQTKKVQTAYMDLLARLGPEMKILLEKPRDALEKEGPELLAEAVMRMRQGRVLISHGYDGEYGTISVLRPEDRRRLSKQLSLY